MKLEKGKACYTMSPPAISCNQSFVTVRMRMIWELCGVLHLVSLKPGQTV